MYLSQRLSLATAVAVVLGTALPVYSLNAQDTGTPDEEGQNLAQTKRFLSPLQFERIATFPVYLNLDSDSDLKTETAAEIIDVSKDGKTLIYSDSPGGKVGFIDIRDPDNPQPAGTLGMGGEPTSVAVVGRYALVAVNTSHSYANPSGHLSVVDMWNRVEVTTLDLGGQPDSVAVSPDGRYAAVAIENERDEDLDDGALPQAPGGFLQIVDLTGRPTNWRVRTVNLNGLADIAPYDPEPEYVDINERNIAAVTLQENNHLVYVDLTSIDDSDQILNHYSAGAVDLDAIDTVEDDVIRLTGSLSQVKREPDAVSWISRNLVAIANEGDYEGGSRGFSIFHRQSGLKFDSGNSYEHIAVRYGHYPESRSENKGSEPEGVEYGRYGSRDFLFVGSERGNFVAVYRIDGASDPQFVQLLPVTNGPEGLKAIPERNLFVVASEVEDAGEGLRSTVTLFRLQAGQASYPTLVSEGEPPIAWGALSALA
ncbi:MAG: alkaline phosphatase, partial [Candidatus Competibacteraceae bacterium]|nr:alkaline phosphatase [Candidatus Competibacteraceae bacterium]